AVSVDVQPLAVADAAAGRLKAEVAGHCVLTDTQVRLLYKRRRRGESVGCVIVVRALDDIIAGQEVEELIEPVHAGCLRAEVRVRTSVDRLFAVHVTPPADLYTLSLHDALPIYAVSVDVQPLAVADAATGRL